jgi:LacI family transcriptional regulator
MDARALDFEPPGSGVKGPKQEVTVWDIAEAAGVSVSTVSRALSGSARVTEAKRAAVLAASEQLHFRPNVVAQGLARGRSRALGVLAKEIGSPFFAPILAGITEVLRDSPYQPIFVEAGPQEIGQALDIFEERRLDGLILVGGWDGDEQLSKVAERMPLVAIGRSLSGHEDRCLHVGNFDGAYAATRHLLELGHKRIAHITGIPSHPDAIDRRNGHQRALEDAKVPCDPRLVVEGDFLETSGFEAVQGLLARRVRFSAIFAANDQMAYGALLALFRRGLRVPRDISLVGFDDQRGARYTTPPLTTVRQPAVEMGKAAAAALLRVLGGGPLELPSFSAELVVRESTARYRPPSRPARPGPRLAGARKRARSSSGG